jgi:hypothetical protein
VSNVEEKLAELQRVYAEESGEIVQKLCNMIEMFVFQTTLERSLTLP